MSFSLLLLVLRARLKIIIITLVITVLGTLLVSLLIPKSYTATASVIVNYKGADPVTGIVMPAQFMPGYMSTQVDIISSKSVALSVIRELKLAQSPQVKENYQSATDGKGTVEDWLATVLLKKLDVVPSRTSSVIEISFSGVNPAFSALIANAFAEAYIQKNIQLKVEPSQKAATYFTQQIKSLRDDLNNAQQRLSQYQQEKGIVSVDERLDVEIARLNDLSSQLVIAQSQMAEAQSRQRNSSGVLADGSPDVAANPLIQGLKSDIARSESKLANLSQTLSPNHPQYQSAKAELDNLRSELNRQIQQTSGTLATNSKILQQREAEIRTSLAAQKEKVLEIKRDRDALAVLTQEVDSAQKAYDLTTQRFSQTNIEGQSDQSDVSILNPAVAPIEASSPRVLLNTFLSIFLGILLGVSLGLIAELMDRRVRSKEDLMEMLGIPVFAEIDNKQNLPKKRFWPWSKSLVKAKG